MKKFFPSKGDLKYDYFANIMAKKLPIANYKTSLLAGGVLGATIGIGEAIGGRTRIILGFLGTAWFILSAIPLVSGGGKSFDWVLGKDSWWNANFPILKRLVVYCISLALGYGLFFNLIHRIFMK